MSGVASDALKVAEYRAVLRMRRSLLQLGAWQSSKGWKAYQNFSRILSKVCIMLPPFRPRVHALFLLVLFQSQLFRTTDASDSFEMLGAPQVARCESF